MPKMNILAKMVYWILSVIIGFVVFGICDEQFLQNFL